MESTTSTHTTYETPRVIDLGSVAEITLGAPIGVPVDPDSTSTEPYFLMQ